jgi:hypothetical protein
MNQLPSRSEAADELREQAASCRRLARTSTSAGGSVALRTVAHQFEVDAARIDPLRATPDAATVDGDWDALVRVRLALERQMAVRETKGGASTTPIAAGPTANAGSPASRGPTEGNMEQLGLRTRMHAR